MAASLFGHSMIDIGTQAIGRNWPQDLDNGHEEIAQRLILADRESSGTPIAVAIMKPSKMRRTLMAILTRYLFDSPTCVSCSNTA